MITTVCKLFVYLLVSLFLFASYKQNGVSIVVHSFINSILPPGSALISQIPNIRWGSAGAPTNVGSHGVFAGCSKCFASGNVNNFGLSTAQYIPFIKTEAYGAICNLKTLVSITCPF